jgi:energy-coupling factor transporter ATP-binding protein EcfA2
MTFTFSIPTAAGAFPISIEPGSSVVFVGANGGGKTRLAVMIEEALSLSAHRISAHRALTLNPAIAKISERQALAGLRTGNASVDAKAVHRIGNRWQSNMAVSLLNDFDFLIQALFADQANKSLNTHKQARAGVLAAEPTKFERLVEIWERLLPHRKLDISGDDILVKVPGIDAQYKSSDMSDGERAIFYMIGQTLAAANDSLLIVDEPELHVHRSIMSKLWDELEAARPDCGFVFITHDLEFAAARVAQKFVIRDYAPAPLWTLEPVPAHAGFSEDVATLILGSRRPILFVEGDDDSIDQAIYRSCFADWTVIPRASCEEVIHSVVTMRRNQALTRVTCSGIVDADDHSPDDIRYLQGLGVVTLPVSEIENLVLLPAVSRAIAEGEGLVGAELEMRLASLKAAVFETLSSEAAIDAVVARHCRRRIDRLLKKIDLSSANGVVDIAAEYQRQTTSLDISSISEKARSRIKAALDTEDLPLLLANYDNKALLALAAQHLKTSKRKDFESWLTRVLRSDKAPALIAAIKQSLPAIQAE